MRVGSGLALNGMALTVMISDQQGGEALHPVLEDGVQERILHQMEQFS